MAQLNEKIVEFSAYCENCVHYDKKESEDPCWDCLDEPARYGTRKPIAFKEKE